MDSLSWDHSEPKLRKWYPEELQNSEAKNHLNGDKSAYKPTTPNKNTPQVRYVFSNYLTRLSRIWRILQIKEGVIHRGRRPRWITPSDIYRILHILRNSTKFILLLYIFIPRNSSYPTKLTQPHPQVFSVNGSIICSGLHFWRHFDIIGSIICSGLHFWRHFDIIGSIICSGLHFWRHWFNI